MSKRKATYIEAEASTQAQRSQTIVAQIRPLLSGAGPDTQGAVVLDLLALWLAGHHPELRTSILENFLAALPAMVEVNEKIMFGDAGFPKEGLS